MAMDMEAALMMDSTRSLRMTKPAVQSRWTFATAVDWNLSVLRCGSQCLGIPIAVGEGTVSMNNSRWRQRLLWMANFGVLVLRTIVMIIGLGLCCTVDRFWNARFVAFYFMAVVAGVIMVAGGFNAFVRHCGEFVLIWNAILKYKSIVKASIIEVWVLQAFPLTLFGAVVVWNTFLALNPHLVIQFRFGVHLSYTQGYLDTPFG